MPCISCITYVNEMLAIYTNIQFIYTFQFADTCLYHTDTPILCIYVTNYDLVLIFRECHHCSNKNFVSSLYSASFIKVSLC